MIYRDLVARNRPLPPSRTATSMRAESRARVRASSSPLSNFLCGRMAGKSLARISGKRRFFYVLFPLATSNESQFSLSRLLLFFSPRLATRKIPLSSIGVQPSPLRFSVRPSGKLCQSRFFACPFPPRRRVEGLVLLCRVGFLERARHKYTFTRRVVLPV